ncbi:hypothetical protein OUO20_13145 [Arthrobacter sp. FX8]|uniref:hypothetical protein n=1 Tax=Arthrobacter sp. FX8 TaxID=2997335 RepID=UPI00227A3E98|nr:hypothetical protein [Arthrobacter sp. FX8]WAJ32122.1 hypothetical protein OUO20_13145 [Arthrobacter sp. FX8]
MSRYANVELDGGTPLKPEADVPGGIGYQTDIGFVCSTGFSAFDPAGLPTVLTAGHCASDGAAKTATLEFQGYRPGPWESSASASSVARATHRFSIPVRLQALITPPSQTPGMSERTYLSSSH